MAKYSKCCGAELLDRDCDFCNETGKDHNKEECKQCKGSGVTVNVECLECGGVVNDGP